MPSVLHAASVSSRRTGPAAPARVRRLLSEAVVPAHLGAPPSCFVAPAAEPCLPTRHASNATSRRPTHRNRATHRAEAARHDQHLRGRKHTSLRAASHSAPAAGAMADDDTLTTASTYWRDAAVLAETFQQKKRPPPKPPTPDLTGMPKLKEHVRIAASRRSYAIDARRLHQRRRWVVLFSILSAFRARSRYVTHTGRHLDPASRAHHEVDLPQGDAAQGRRLGRQDAGVGVGGASRNDKTTHTGPESNQGRRKGGTGPVRTAVRTV